VAASIGNGGGYHDSLRGRARAHAQEQHRARSIGEHTADDVGVGWVQMAAPFQDNQFTLSLGGKIKDFRGGFAVPKEQAHGSGR